MDKRPEPSGPGANSPNDNVSKEGTTSNLDDTDTVTRRVEIGFPEDQENEPATFEAVLGADEVEYEILRIGGQPVMESWERPYMLALAEVASSNGGKTLELGLGLAISAKAILADPDVTEHNVIEANKFVIEEGKKRLKEDIEKGRAKILPGLWQNVISTLPDESFDGIMFDTYPKDEEEIHKNHVPFLIEAYRLLKPGGIFTYYSDVDTEEEFNRIEVARLLAVGFKIENIRCEVCPVKPRPGCEYWKKNSLVVPIITKPAEPQVP